MSWTWFVYAPLPQAELLEIADAFHEAVVTFLEEHPDIDDDFGEVDAGGPVPTLAEVNAFHAAHADAPPIAPAALVRLATCRGSLAIAPVPALVAIDRLGSPLQVSCLQHLLEAIGPCVMDWGELRLALSESVLADLALQPNRGPLLADDEDEEEDDGEEGPSFARARKDPTRARAARCIELLRAAIEDVERSVDAQRALRKQSETARGYAALLLEDGPMTDAVAARALGVPEAELSTAAAALVAALEALEE